MQLYQQHVQNFLGLIIPYLLIKAPTIPEPSTFGTLNTKGDATTKYWQKLDHCSDFQENADLG